MGLDMYLTRKKFIGANYEHRKVEGLISITSNGKEIPIDFNKVSYIEESIAYWRKANAIHNWFVENVQDGEDDCKSYEVGLEDLEKLVKLCKIVRENHDKAEELLPTTSGFFFGSTDYDDWYFHNIDETIEQLKKVLEEEKKLNSQGIYNEFYYTSSW